LCLRQVIRSLAGLAEIVSHRHCSCGLNKTHPDGANRHGNDGILSKAKESPTVRCVHHLSSPLLSGSSRRLKGVKQPRTPREIRSTASRIRRPSR